MRDRVKHEPRPAGHTGYERGKDAGGGGERQRRAMVATAQTTSTVEC
jgi:hypothetical protein